MRSIGVLFTAVVVLAGCKKAPPVAQPAPTPAASEPAAADGPPAELVAMFERAMVLVEEIAVAAEAAGGDCVKVAANLEQVAAGRNGDAMVVLGKQEAAFKPHIKAIAESRKEQVEPLFTRMLAVVAPCHSNGDVVDVMTRLGLAGRKVDEPEDG